jgi:hypothetical protein
MSVFFRMCPEDSHTCIIRNCLRLEGLDDRCPQTTNITTPVAKTKRGWEYKWDDEKDG